MTNWEERDILEEIENRAWDYVREFNDAPDVAILSQDLFVALCHQMCEIQRIGPTVNVSTIRGRWITLNTGNGQINIEECDKFGSDFLFVGKKTDIFPQEGELSLAEKFLLEEKK